MTQYEEFASGYVAGWLENKCDYLEFDCDDSVLHSQASDFIIEVSRGGLTVPHTSTFTFVKLGVAYLNKASSHLCCQSKLINILSIMNAYFEIGFYDQRFFKRLANVLLHGLHKLMKDKESDALYQTAIKKARLS